MNSDLIKLLSDLGKTTVTIRGHAVTVRRLNARDEMLVQRELPTPQILGDNDSDRTAFAGGLPYRRAWAENDIRKRALRVGLACSIPTAAGAEWKPSDMAGAIAYADHVLALFTSEELLELQDAAEGKGGVSQRMVLGNSSAPSRNVAGLGPKDPPVLIEDGVSQNGTG